nr:hypothetical protein [Candidatus Sigynarchaeota archaeon]
MVAPSLKGIAEQVTALVENLSFNGLNLVTEEIIRNIEMLLQSASMVNAFRLAVSLRYLHVELKRFLSHDEAFNLERYVFYLGNCWLLSRAF